ncbi:hypothetical protein EJB05_30506, partial [Eragrostis curvula]
VTVLGCRAVQLQPLAANGQKRSGAPLLRPPPHSPAPVLFSRALFNCSLRRGRSVTSTSPHHLHPLPCSESSKLPFLLLPTYLLHSFKLRAVRTCVPLYAAFGVVVRDSRNARCSNRQLKSLKRFEG